MAEDVECFFQSRQSALLRLSRGTIALSDAVALVLHLIGERDSETVALSRKVLTEKIWAVGVSAQNVEIASMTDLAPREMPLHVLPSILKQCCGLDMPESRLEGIVHRAAKKPRFSTDGKRIYSSGAIVATDAALAHNQQVVAQEQELSLSAPAVFDQGELQILLARAEEENAGLRGKLKSMQIQLYKKQQALDSQSQRLIAVTEELEQFRQSVCWRPKKKWMSPIGAYTLAISRQASHAGNEAIVEMIAADEVRGGFDPSYGKRLTVWEHRARACQVMIAREKINEMFEMPSAGTASCMHLEVFLHEGDSTNQEALDKQKAHVSRVSAVSCYIDDDDQLACDDIDMSFPWASFMRARPDLQTEVLGTGEELYFMTLREMQSVGIPTFEDRVEQSVQTSRRFSVYVSGVDRGPNCQNCARRVRSKLKGIKKVACATIWCFFHALQLAFKDHIALVEGFDFEGVELPCRFHGGLATIANTWRSVGVPRKLTNACIALYDRDQAARHVQRLAKLPQRCLRGRWGSTYAVLFRILQVVDILPRLFSHVFTRETLGDAEAGSLHVSIGQEEAQNYRDEQKKYRKNATTLLNSLVFQALLHISHVVEAIFNHCLAWFQKKK